MQTFVQVYKSKLLEMSLAPASEQRIYWVT